MQTKLLIKGQLVEGEGAATPVLDPATGEQVASVREASPAQIQSAVDAAAAAAAAATAAADTDNAAACRHRR